MAEKGFAGAGATSSEEVGAKKNGIGRVFNPDTTSSAEVKAEASAETTSPEEVSGAINEVTKAFARPNSTSSAEVKVGAKNAVGMERMRPYLSESSIFFQSSNSA